MNKNLNNLRIFKIQLALPISSCRAYPVCQLFEIYYHFSEIKITFHPQYFRILLSSHSEMCSPKLFYSVKYSWNKINNNNCFPVSVYKILCALIHYIPYHDVLKIYVELSVNPPILEAPWQQGICILLVYCSSSYIVVDIRHIRITCVFHGWMGRINRWMERWVSKCSLLCLGNWV